MLVFLLSSLLKASHCYLLLPIEKMVPVLMLVPGTFGVEIGSVRFSMSVCSTFFRVPIFRSQLSRCYLLEKIRGERVGEVEKACFSLLVFSATGDMGPTATTVYIGSLLQCWLRSMALIAANAYSGCDVAMLCFSLLRS